MVKINSITLQGTSSLERRYSTTDVAIQHHICTSATSKFITAFSNSFLAMAISLNPSDKYNASDVTPAHWNAWTSGYTEMLFNVTSSGEPNIYTYTTAAALLNRCA
ncbi:hypothetical protein JVT61DRAFT_3372 [Boletus reticuloceps]|uniref:Uncharacterized protein n=1 Tax=Boletus reticuloceps TaxID=495285 RepID=A0A8I2YNL4_9AGAM|nr:hypothetical protein JVT61DRAFT_3596 [Boletus reticuloceps]KAG6375165.1 hypothetical protein JVT61DRAFT_3372 [Boletus reticuloceps]